MSTTIRMISNRRHSLKNIANVHVDTDTGFVLLFTGDCACCFRPRLPVFCAVLQHVRHETMVGAGPGKRQGVCVNVIYVIYVVNVIFTAAFGSESFWRSRREGMFAPPGRRPGTGTQPSTGRSSGPGPWHCSCKSVSSKNFKRN